MKKQAFAVTITLTIAWAYAGTACAQTGNGTGNTGDTGQGQTNTTVGAGGDSQFDLGATLQDFQIAPPETVIENERLQPFVGRSRARYEEQGLTHHRSLMHPVRGRRPNVQRESTWRWKSAGRRKWGGQHYFGNASQPSLTPQATNCCPFTPVSRTDQRPCQQRLNRMLSATNTTSTVSIAISNRVAQLQGTVVNAAIKDRLERIMRLEPGISKIENQIQISN